MDTPNQGIPRPPAPPRTELPAPIDPSPAVRIAKEIREGFTDTLGILLAGYLAIKQVIQGTHALGFVLLLLLPSPVLMRLAKILGTRGSATAALLVSASTAYSHIKLGIVAGLGTGAALAACGAT